MAQGKHKAPKVQVPGKKKENKREKQMIKKGKFKIAPKKSKLQEAEKLKKGLEKSIRAHIEDELTQKTTALEPKSLKFLASTSKSSSTSKGASTSKSKS